MKSWLADLPSTNARIATSLFMALATAARVIGFGWEPPIEWLAFLSLWAGLDVAQYVGKRATHMESPPARPDIEDSAAHPPTADEQGDL